MDNPKPMILFDFDGTLADTLELVHEIYNRLSSVYGYRHLSAVELQAFRHLTLHEFIEQAGIPIWKVPLIAMHARHLMHQDIDAMHPPAGLVEVLTKIHDSRRYDMGILTSNRRKNVLKFMDKHAMGWFDEIHTTRSVLSKKHRIEKFIAQKGLDPKRLYYVGDTSVDDESVRHADEQSVAVTWGFNTHAVLERAAPTFLIDQPHELADVFAVA